jgi:hypothetical protein
LEVNVRRTTAEAPPTSMLARVADLLGWPQVAEASHCSVTGGGVTGVNVGGEQYVLTGPTLNADNSLDVAVSCGADSGTLRLTGLTPGTAVEVEVRTSPGRLSIEAQAEDVSDVSEASISEGDAESESESEHRSGSNSGSG